MNTAAFVAVLGAALATCALTACSRTPPPVSPATPASAQATPPATPAPPPSPTPPPPPEAAVPARFQGTWARDAAACATAGHESRLVLSADSVRFHESSGPISRTTANGDDLTLVVMLTGEGQTREASYRFSISDGGATLTDRDADVARTRCQ